MTTSSEALEKYALTWQRKAVLRAVYEDSYDRLAAECRPGLSIEIGGGIGNLKQHLDGAIATDIQFASWLACVADAQRLPFAAGVLRPGGRVLMVEPAITWGSTLFYRLFHHEPVRTSADALVDGRPDPLRDPYDSNQAIPTILATRDRARFHDQFCDLRIVRVDWFAFAAYPLSGVFQPWSLIGAGMARRLLRIERAIEPVLGRLAGFRMLIVIEKTAGPAGP
jgi:hypothetical protein